MIRTQRVVCWKHLEIGQVEGPISVRLIQPEERLVFVAKTDVNICKGWRRHITASVEFEQLVQYLDGLSFAPGQAITHSQKPKRSRRPRQGSGFFRGRDGFGKPPTGRIGMTQEPVGLIIVLIHRDDSTKLFDGLIVAARVLQCESSFHAYGEREWI